MCRRHIQPGGKSGKAGAFFLHATNCPGRHQLGAQHAEKVNKTDQEILDFFLLGDSRQIDGHSFYPPLKSFFTVQPVNLDMGDDLTSLD